MKGVYAEVSNDNKMSLSSITMQHYSNKNTAALLGDRSLGSIAAHQRLVPISASHRSSSHRHHREMPEQSSAHSPKSRSIPIHASTMKRTPSELKLREDEALADFRDYVMFRRIVDRISQQQEQITDMRLRRENDMCLAHLIGIRNGSEDNLEDLQHQRYLLADFIQPRHHHYPMPQRATMAMEANPAQEDDEMFALDL